MRRTITQFFAVFSLAFLGRAEELAINGGFEDPAGEAWLAKLPRGVRDFYAGTADSPFAGWAFGGRFERGEYSVAVSDQGRTGLRSCEITCLKKGRGAIASSPLRLDAGAVVEVSFWIKAREAGGGRIFLNFEGTPGDGWASKDLKTGSYDWTRFTQRAVVPPGQTSGPQTVVVFLYTSCDGSIWVDDFSIRSVDPKDDVEPTVAEKSPAAFPEPAGSKGYRVNVVSPLEKVFRDDDFSASVRSDAELAAARNEHESLQLVVEAPWRSVTVEHVRISGLHGPGGAVIPASAAKWERVDYIRTTVTPPYFAERGLASYPDPLLPAGPFIVAANSRTPLWITLKTPKDCPPGEYTGTITLTPKGHEATVVPVRLTVWDFALADETHLRTMTWLSPGTLRQWYGLDESPEGEQKLAEALRNYQDCLLEHRLGPGGEVADRVPVGEDGRFDFRAVDATLQRLVDRGMNAFIMGTAPNLARAKQTRYTPEFTRQFTNMLAAYSGHLRERGWLDRAYVYVYDEAPKAAWPEVKKIDQAIRAAAPHVPILQCLNEPEGVRELTGFADVFDVYVGQYHRAGVAESQRKGAEVWLAVCAYPVDHPNFFVEYPLLDLRVTPWICWKYRANGFEYWSATSWGINGRSEGGRWPEVPWVAHAFGRYNGDGYLLYPGADLKPYSSIRFEALRDGLEDYEYFWTLNSLLQKADARKISGPAVETARALLTLDGLVRPSGGYSPRIDDYSAHRRRLAEAIVALGAEVVP
jgi:hypothetical protein